MPVTPFHLGPGLAVKAAAPGRVSLVAYSAAQVVIDLESGYNLFAGRFPVHRILHTFALGAPVGAIVGMASTWVTGRLVPRLRTDGRPEWRAEASLRAGAVGGLLGGALHSLLDGIMHGDIRPFRPFTDANPLFRLLSLSALHWLCVILGLLGLLWLGKNRGLGRQ